MERLKLCLVVVAIALAAPSHAENQCGFSGFSHPLDQTGGQTYKLSRGMLASAIIHLGDDFIALEKTPVRAIADGKIVVYRASEGYGELVCVIEHDLGSVHSFLNSKDQTVSTRYLLSIYGHIRKSQEREGKPLLWEVGNCVNRGDIIGYVNDDEHNGIGGEHLHLGVRLMNAHEAQNRDPGLWYRGFAYSTGFEADFADPLTVIQGNLVPEFAIGQFPPWGIAGLNAAHVGQKFRDARDAPNRFLDAYRNAGFLNVSMKPYDNDQKEGYEGRYVHWWTVLSPPGIQGPNLPVLVQDVKLRALRGNGTNVFTREEALLIYNPQTDMAYIVKEGFWGLYLERNGPVTLGAPIGDEEGLSNGSVEQHFQRGYCFYDPRNNVFEAYNANRDIIPKYSINFIIAGTGGDNTYALDAPVPPPDPIIPLANVKLVIQPAELGYRYQLQRGQKSLDFSGQLSHSGGNQPITYKFYVDDVLVASGTDPMASTPAITPGTHVIRARVEAGSGNTLQAQEVSQSLIIETAPKSDWGVPFEVKVNTIAQAGGYIYIAGEYVSGANAGKGFLRRVLGSNPEQGESYTFPFSFNKILPRDSYLFAATSSGLMVSKDQGANWSTVFSNGQAYDIAILPGDKWNDWPILILVGCSGGTPVYYGFWTPSEPNNLSVVRTIGGFGPYTLLGGRISREEMFMVGSGPNGIQTRKGPYHLAYTNPGGQLGQLPNTYAGRAWAIFSSGPELWVALKTNAGDNVYYNDDYGGSRYQKALGIGPGDDVAAFTWIDGIPGPSAITRKGILYYAPVSRTQWRAIAGFSQALALDLAAGQLATTILGVGQNLLIGTERGLRVMPVANIKTLAAAKPVVAAEERFASADSTTLLGNYPNPFNPETTIQYALATGETVELRIYNLLGQVVRTLVNERQTAGRYAIRWDGKDSAGRSMASGMYIYRLEAGKFSASRKLMFLK